MKPDKQTRKTMLLQFSVANFRSIYHKCTFSMLAKNGITDEPKNNVFQVRNKKILRTSAIYGANSSGKTNLVRAISEMKRHIVGSTKLNEGERLNYEPFKLIENNALPTFFEAKFIIDTTIFKYGFELTSKAIVGEWLYMQSPNEKKEKILFIRTEEGIAVEADNFPEGVDKEELTNDNRLFLSLCGQLRGNISNTIISWFEKEFNIISGIDSQYYLEFSKQMFHDHLAGCEQAYDFLRRLKLGIQSIQTKEVKLGEDIILPADMPEDVKKKLWAQLKDETTIKLLSQHHIYNKDGGIVKTELFDIETMESDGTKKMIQLSGPFFDSLTQGKTLVIDELDAKMHPLISQYIIELYNDPKRNPNNAQLIFTTHDTHLLSSRLLRRDQIWFTEKNDTEQTDLYNMMNIKLPDNSTPRHDANYGKNYIAGRYGAIPYIIND